MISTWESFKSIRLRSLYKNKYLTGCGLTKLQINAIMRKMKVYIDRIEQSPLSIRTHAAGDIQELATIFEDVFNNKWKEYIKDSYKDIPFYFQDYCNFIMLMREYVRTYPITNNLTYPNGEPIQLEDFVESVKAKRNHIKLIIDGEANVYPATKALTVVISKIGLDSVYAANYKVVDMKVLIKHVPLGKEKKYTSIGGGWFLCTLGDTMSKLRLIKILVMHFHKEIRAEIV